MLGNMFGFMVEIGDIIGWIGFIILFVTIPTLLWVVIYFLYKRANGSGKTSDDMLSNILNQIEKLDNKIRELLTEIERLKQQRDQLKIQAQQHARLRQELENRHLLDVQYETPLLVAVGADSILQMDLSALRAVRNDTGMQFVRIDNASYKKIKQYLNNARSNERPFNKMHLSVHSGPDGIYLGGEVITGVQLSEILEGIDILVIAGCESDTVATALGVVDYVVSFSEKVVNEEAAIFTQAFWTEIGRKKSPEEALRLALIRSPVNMGEYIMYNW